MIRVRFICICFLTIAILAGVSQTAVAAPAVTIEAGRTGEPISKYVYGQFIEHQGRCIYGGIWAEMIEDRKFYFPIAPIMPGVGVISQGGMGVVMGAEISPWRPIGLNKNVIMTQENSYVGKHSPRVKLDGQTLRGIMQDGLALRNGKKYEGRVVLAGSSSAKVQVSLVWGSGHNGRQTITIDNLTDEYTKTPLSFTATGDADNGRIEIVGSGEGSFYIGAVSLMAGDNIHGMRADTIKLLKELDGTVYRWPGGIFVNSYDWRDGIGDPDKRPAYRTYAYYDLQEQWVQTLETNDFGMDEFLTLCRIINTEPYIAVNSGFGDDHSAGQQVEYANGSTNTPMGKLRAANGHREPYNVKLWGIGNEMWVPMVEGYMALSQYVIKHNLFADAMRKADPSIKLVAVGDMWSETMLGNCAEHMDFISEHFYCDEISPAAAHARQIPDRVRGVAAAHRDYCNRLDSLKDKDILIVMDEWNYGYGPELYGEAAPRRFFKDGLGIAEGLHEIYRNSDIFFMANTHPINVHGGIKTTKTEIVFETQGLVMKMYRQHFGNLPVAVTGNAEPLSVAVAWTDDHKALTIGIVNATEQKYKLAMNLEDAQLTGEGQLWQIVHCDPMGYNEPGQEPQVVIEEKPLRGISNELSVSPMSINIYKLAVR